MPSCQGISPANERPVQGLNLNAMLAALGELLGSGVGKPGGQPLVRVVVDGLGQDGELVQMFGGDRGDQALDLAPGAPKLDGSPGTAGQEGDQQEEVGAVAPDDDKFQPVGTHELGSLEATGGTPSHMLVDGLKFEMVFGGPLEGLVPGVQGLDHAGAGLRTFEAHGRENGDDTLRVSQAGQAVEGGTWDLGADEIGAVPGPIGDVPCQGTGGTPGGSSLEGIEDERRELIPCVTSAALPWYSDWGLLSSGVSALEARVCPVPGAPDIESLCHVLDRWPDHSCRRDHDCGIDGNTCRRRRCTRFNFCQAA